MSAGSLTSKGRNEGCTVVEPHDGLAVEALDVVPAAKSPSAPLTKAQQGESAPRELLEHGHDVHVGPLLDLARVGALELAEGHKA